MFCSVSSACTEYKYFTAHRHNLTDLNSHMESVKMTTVKEVGLHRADETTVASSRRRPLIMTPSMEEAEDNANL